MLYSGDERQHNNPNLAYVDADAIRGGARVVASLAELYELGVKSDQLKNFVSWVWVTAEATYYQLIDKDNIANPLGWLKDPNVKKDVGGIAQANGLATSQAYYGNNALISKGPYKWAASESENSKWAQFNDQHPDGYRLEVFADTLITLAGYTATDLPDNVIPGRQLTRGVRPGLLVHNITTNRPTFYNGAVYKDVATTDDLPYKGTYLSVTALQAITGLPGQYATVDTGDGTDAQGYSWDSSDNKWVPTSNTGASNFSQLAGNPTDNGQLASALDAAKNRANHTGTQTANTISNFASATLGTPATGLAAVNASPAATDTILTLFGKLKYLWDNFSTLVSNLLSTSKYLDQSGAKTYVELAYDAVNFVYSANMAPAITAYSAGLAVTVRITNTHVGAGEPKLSLNGLAAINIRKYQNTVLEAGDLQLGVYTLVYNGFVFLIENSGLQFASDTENTAGTSTTKAVNPKGLNAWFINKLAGSVVFQGAVQFASLSALNNRMLMLNAAGSLIAGPDVITGGFEVDGDIINQIANATNNNLFTEANNYQVSINPDNGKIFYQGKWYNGGQYLYFAVGDNQVRRMKGA